MKPMPAPVLFGLGVALRTAHRPSEPGALLGEVDNGDVMLGAEELGPGETGRMTESSLKPPVLVLDDESEEAL